MARISLADAKKIGIKLDSLKNVEHSVSIKNKRNRIKFRDSIEDKFDNLFFTIYLDKNPKPKERPRTTINLNKLYDIFLKSKGNLRVFKDLIKSEKMFKTYTPKQTLDYEKIISNTVQNVMIGKKIYDCQLELKIVFTLIGEEEWPTSPADGDIDNLEKAVLDAMNKIVYVDDRLIVANQKIKICGNLPKIDVFIRPMKKEVISLYTNFN